jgi:hypothetical protein
MIKIKNVILLSLVLGSYSFEAEARDCVIPRFRADWGLEMPVYLTFKKNTNCPLLISSVGQDEMTITQAPKNGVAKPISSGVNYKANNNFIGTDEFVFVRKGRDRYGNPAESRLRVSVQVVNDL